MESGVMVEKLWRGGGWWEVENYSGKSGNWWKEMEGIMERVKRGGRWREVKMWIVAENGGECKGVELVRMEIMKGGKVVGNSGC